jgi:hypothetical protein
VRRGRAATRARPLRPLPPGEVHGAGPEPRPVLVDADQPESVLLAIGVELQERGAHARSVLEVGEHTPSTRG